MYKHILCNIENEMNNNLNFFFFVSNRNLNYLGIIGTIHKGQTKSKLWGKNYKSKKKVYQYF